MFLFFGHFFPISGEMFSLVFPGHFSAPRSLPAGFSFLTKSTLTANFPTPQEGDLVTSPLAWRQSDDNCCLLSYSRKGPFGVRPEGPRTLPTDPISLKQLPPKHYQYQAHFRNHLLELVGSAGCVELFLVIPSVRKSI